MSTLSGDLDYYDRTVAPDGLSQSSASTESAGPPTPTPEETLQAGPEAATEEAESEPGSFASSLWSEKESSAVRSLDSWDLPEGPVAWDDNDRPMERLLTYADLTLTEEEENGLLTDRIVAACGSYLTESPGNKCHVVGKVLLNNKNLYDIRILGYHRFLQYVDLSWNNLTDLSPLGCLPYLMYLDVSHNLLEEVLRFNPPLNLTYVNYSYNEVWQIDDLTDFWALCYLDLSHNKISKIQGLHNLRYLRYLDLSHNKIERFGNLAGLRITDLNLEYNLISRFEKESGYGMDKMPQLTNVYLNNNLITDLEFLKEVSNLRKLDLQCNNVSDLVQLTNLKRLKHLRCLDMSGNPVSELKPYRQLVLNFLQELKFLDQTEVDISERVAACKTKTFDVQLEAARNHARMILLDQLNDTTLGLDVLPVDQGPYPFVVLVGPSASSKKRLVDVLATKYPEKIRAGRLHTTRNVADAEKNVLVHLPREEFAESIKAGRFLCVSESLGHLYGFSKEELGLAVKERKLCLTAMDMVAALTLHGYGIQPFLILALPRSKEDHTRRLKEAYGPMIAMLGAAYMTRWELIDTHESNVKRVRTILGDLINAVVPPDSEDGLQPLEQDFSSDFHLPKFMLDETTSSAMEPSDQDGQSEVCYSVPQHLPPHEDSQEQAPRQRATPRGSPAKKCYPCTPSRCGLQLAQMDQDELPLMPTQRLSATDSEEAGGVTESMLTSYSNGFQLPLKVEGTSPGYSIGEDEEVFLDWSTPFIDWNEVNVNGLQLEEAAEALCDRYIENVMAVRDVYQSLHLENPGLFSLTVFTDEEEKAVRDVTKFLKEVWRSTPSRRPPFDLKNDLVYQAFVPRKLDKLKEILRNDFHSADGDGTCKGVDDVAPINSPASVAAEMRSKGYGDVVE